MESNGLKSTEKEIMRQILMNPTLVFNPAYGAIIKRLTEPHPKAKHDPEEEALSHQHFDVPHIDFSNSNSCEDYCITSRMSSLRSLAFPAEIPYPNQHQHQTCEQKSDTRSTVKPQQLLAQIVAQPEMSNSFNENYASIAQYFKNSNSSYDADVSLNNSHITSFNMSGNSDDNELKHEIPRDQVEPPMELMVAKMTLDELEALSLKVDGSRIPSEHTFMKMCCDLMVHPLFPGSQLNSKKRKHSEMNLSDFTPVKNFGGSSLNTSFSTDAALDLRINPVNIKKEPDERSDYEAHCEVLEMENPKLEQFLQKIRENRNNKPVVMVGPIESLSINIKMKRSYPNIPTRTLQEQERRDKNTSAARICREKIKRLEQVVKQQSVEAFEESITKKRILAAHKAYAKELEKLIIETIPNGAEYLMKKKMMFNR